MIIGDRLQALRQAKGFSLGDVEKRTGLLRYYISRVENGHAVPTVETLEKIAWALEVPVHQLFYDGDEPPSLPNLPNRLTADDVALGISCGRNRSFMKFDQRLHAPDDFQISVPLTKTRVIRVCLSKSCPSETRHSFWGQYCHSNLTQNDVDAANKT